MFSTCPSLPTLATKTSSASRRTNWVEADTSRKLVWLMLDDIKGNPHRQSSLPPCLYSDLVASFLHFDKPLPNQLYVLGGRNHSDGPLDTVEMFDTWYGRWVTCPSMAVRRAGCGAAMLSDCRILCVGGYDERGIVKGLLSSCEAFDPATQTWSSAVASLDHSRWGHGCAASGGLVYAVGGCSLRPGAPPRESFMETLRSCEVYDPERDCWHPCADLNMARAGSRIVTLGDRYFAAVGGCDDVFGRAEMLPTVELFDTANCRWTLLDVHLSTPRTTAAVAALDDRRILVTGGAPSLSTSEIYYLPDPSSVLAADADEVSSHASSGASATAPTGAASEALAAEAEALPVSISDIAEGRMGCQAAALLLPRPGDEYPKCSRNCVVVVGGENGEEDWETSQGHVRQFNTALVFDTKDNEWRPAESLPPMVVPRTAMALCVGAGYIRGYPSMSPSSARVCGGS